MGLHWLHHCHERLRLCATERDDSYFIAFHRICITINFHIFIIPSEHTNRNLLQTSLASLYFHIHLAIRYLHCLAPHSDFGFHRCPLYRGHPFIQFLTRIVFSFSFFFTIECPDQLAHTSTNSEALKFWLILLISLP